MKAGFFLLIVCGCVSAPAFCDDRPKWQQSVIERVGDGWVTRERPPREFLPEQDILKIDKKKNFLVFFEACSRWYSFFKLKKIDWEDLKDRYLSRIEAATTSDEFYATIKDLIRELQDFHTWVNNYWEGDLGWRRPSVTIERIEGKAVVTEVMKGSTAEEKGLLRGSIILEVDGVKVSQRIESMRQQIRAYSSQRGYLAAAFGRLLDGPKNSQVSIKFLVPKMCKPKTIELSRTSSRLPLSRRPSFPVETLKHVWYGRHSSGIGYIRILSFEGREEIADEFDVALAALKDVPGIVLDIRNNEGGTGISHKRIIGRLLSKEVKDTTVYVKDGPGYSQFRKRESSLRPTGAWQFSKPVALLFNAVTGSAADLFAARLVGAKRVLTVGVTTHGNLSGNCAYVVLPCGLIVRLSIGYVTYPDGVVVEGRGNVPVVKADQLLKDVRSNRDSVLEKAVELLKAQELPVE
jgi:carboxyl-terminal processing protease